MFFWARPLFAKPQDDPDERWEHVFTVMPPLQFEVNGVLKKNLQFWVGIYTQYDTQQGLIHDAKYIDHVYEVVDLKNGDSTGERSVRRIKKKWRDLLISVHHKQNHPDQLNEEEKKVFNLYGDVNEPNKFLNAAHRKRLRFQLGQKDRFLEGLKYSGKYLPHMEEIFKKEGMPIELTRLPFVESSFNIKARSKVGASGIWQFMRSTGRLFLKINDHVDERNDPFRATEAAAKLLRLNFESLRSWPLAVTAYNHGRKGMMRAVRKVGAEDLEEVVSGYRSRSFGFASSNFFTELLAAIEVEKNAEKYFGKVERLSPDSFIEVPIPHYVSLRELVRFLKLDQSRIRELNPGLSEAVLGGRDSIPAGYLLRLPSDAKDQSQKEAQVRLFTAGYEQIPQIFKQQRGQAPRSYGRRR